MTGALKASKVTKKILAATNSGCRRDGILRLTLALTTAGFRLCVALGRLLNLAASSSLLVIRAGPSGSLDSLSSAKRARAAATASGLLPDSARATAAIGRLLPK